MEKKRFQGRTHFIEPMQVQDCNRTLDGKNIRPCTCTRIYGFRLEDIKLFLNICWKHFRKRQSNSNKNTWTNLSVWCVNIDEWAADFTAKCRPEFFRHHSPGMIQPSWFTKNHKAAPKIYRFVGSLWQFISKKVSSVNSAVNSFNAQFSIIILWWHQQIMTSES